MKSSVGSFVGTSELLRTTRCPRSSKNVRMLHLNLIAGPLLVSRRMPSVETVHYRRGSQRSQRHVMRRAAASRPNEAKCGKDSCTDSSVQKGTVWKLFRPACTNSVRLFSCFHITSVLISNGNQNMKSYSQSRDLPDRPAHLRPAGLPPLVVHELRATGRESKFTNHESGFADHSSPVAHHCHLLIASRQIIRNPSNLLAINEKTFSNR